MAELLQTAIVIVLLAVGFLEYRRGGQDRWFRASSVVTLGLVVGLFITGLLLTFFYRPSVGLAADGPGQLPKLVEFGTPLTDVHRWLSNAAIVVAVAALVFAAAHVAPTRLGRCVLGSAIVVLSLVAFLTGQLLPWDAVSTWTVVRGDLEIRGFWFLRDDDVRFVMFDGERLGSATILRWLYLHVTVGLVVLGLAVMWSRRRRFEPPPPTAQESARTS